MPSESRKPVLLAWLDGLPEVENLYPLLALLNERDRIGLRVLVSRAVMRREPRLEQAFGERGLHPIVAGQYRMKRFTGRDIAAADAAISLSDPARDLSTKHKRSARLFAAGMPSIFLQHGALQAGLNVPLPKTLPGFASRLLLLWNPGGGEDAVLAEAERGRAVTVGFTKAPVFGDRRLSAPVHRWLERHPRRLLVCHSFRWSGGRYDENDVTAFYRMLERFLEMRPDCGVILRPHRGKRRAVHAKLDDRLQKRHANILISNEKSGPLKGNSILDDLALVEAAVTPESTTVLDAIYAGRTAAVWDTECRLFTDLPRIRTLEDLLAFASRPGSSAQACDDIRKAYGTFPENLRRCAEAIENFMLK